MFSTKRILPELVLLLALTQRVDAACTNPAGNEGDLSYNGTYHVGTFCNGTNWVAMGNYSSGTIDLTSQVTGTLPVSHGGTGTGTAFTSGSVVFAGASGIYSQDNANFFWDATNHRLGLGATTPQSNLSVSGGVAIGTTYANTNAAASNNLLVQGNVGIGTTSPQAALDVNGTIDIKGANGIWQDYTKGSLAVGSTILPSTSTQTANTAVGVGALSNSSTQLENTAVGYNAISNTSSAYATAVGANAGQTVGGTANWTVFVGAEAGQSAGSGGGTGSGTNATMVGSAAGRSATGNVSNTVFLGAGAGESAAGGGGDANHSILIGVSAGAQAGNGGGSAQRSILIGNNAGNQGGTDGVIDDTIMMGYQAGAYAGGRGGTFVQGVAIGANAGYDAGYGSGGVGDRNILIGYNAGYNAGNAATGADNIMVGYGAGYNGGTNQTVGGSGNILIGKNVTTPASSTSNFLNIGDLIFGTGLSNGTTVSTGSVGIGSTSPVNTLDVTGTGIHIGSGVPSATTYQLYNNGGTLMWNGSSVGGGGGGSGTVTSSTAGQVAYYQSTGTTVIGTSTLNIIGGQVGVGTATFTQQLTVNGNIDAMGSYNGYITEIPNSSTATVANKLAKMYGANTVTIGTTGDTDGMIGVVVGGAGTTGSAQIAIAGQANCAFDSAPTAIGDWVTISSTAAGDCHDSGTKTRSGVSGQIIGQAMNTTGSGGNYPVALSLNGPPGSGSSSTYDLAFFMPGMPDANALMRKVFVRTATYPANLTGSYCVAATGSTSGSTVAIHKISSGTSASIGSIAFASGAGTNSGCTFTFSSSVTFAPGDVIEFAWPGAQDNSLANIAITLLGTHS